MYSKRTAGYPLSPHIKTIALAFLWAKISINKMLHFVTFRKKVIFSSSLLIFKYVFRVWPNSFWIWPTRFSQLSFFSKTGSPKISKNKPFLWVKWEDFKWSHIVQHNLPIWLFVKSDIFFQFGKMHYIFPYMKSLKTRILFAVQGV